MRRDTAVVVLGVVGALLCLVAVLAATTLGPVTVSADSPLDRLTQGGGETDGTGEAEVVEVEESDALPVPERDGGIPPEVVLSMAVALVAGALLVRSLLRARPDETVAEDEEPEDRVDGGDGGVLEAVAAAARRCLDRLDGSGPGAADEAVLACWVELESAGSRLGTGRERTDTPTDFARRLAGAVPGLEGEVQHHLEDLRQVYSRVRYGSEGARPDDVDRARTALRHLLVALAPGEAVSPRMSPRPAARGVRP